MNAIRTPALVLASVALATFGAGCGGDSKVEIPTKLVQPPGPDAEIGNSDGGAKGKKKVLHSDKETSDATTDK